MIGWTDLSSSMRGDSSEPPSQAVTLSDSRRASDTADENALMLDAVTILSCYSPSQSAA